MPTRVTIAQLAQELGAQLIPGEAADGATALSGVGPIAAAGPGLLTFVANEEFAAHLVTTAASAVVVRVASAVPLRAAQLVHANPYWVFAKAAQRLHPPATAKAGISPHAQVDPSATVDPSAEVHPFVTIGPRAKVGPRVILYPGVFIGAGAEVGADTVVRANAVIEYGVRVGARVLIHAAAVIGADGFGFAPGSDGLAKIPQIGAVAIGDDVEIGAVSSVDRGAMEDTVIGRGSKLDSHVHVGHGAVVGESCVLCGLSGLAGSARLGKGVMIGGHAAVDNRVEIADGVQVGALSGVTKDLPERGVYLGFPAIPAGEWRRQIARVRRLEALEARVKALEAALAAGV